MGNKMAQSSSTTIIQVVNQDTFINEVNSCGGSIGMGPIALGTSISDAAATFNQHLQQKLVTQFNSVYGVALPGQNQDNGYMGPIANLQPGDAPLCVVNQVTADFSNWNLPGTTDIATRIAEAITQELSTQGGVAGFTQGTLEVSSNENIIWMAGYGVFSIQQSQLGAVYVFGAALQF
jgi:hypothetical protein